MKSKKGTKINAKQQAFVDEYMIDMNATKACVRAGYSAKTADRIGPELLGKTWVADAIAKAIAKRAEETRRTALDVLKDIQADTRAAREQGDLKTSLRGLELEGKHLGMFVERRELSGPNGSPIAVRPLSAFYGDGPSGEDEKPEGEEG